MLTSRPRLSRSRLRCTRSPSPPISSAARPPLPAVSRTTLHRHGSASASSVEFPPLICPSGPTRGSGGNPSSLGSPARRRLSVPSCRANNEGNQLGKQIGAGGSGERSLIWSLDRTQI